MASANDLLSETSGEVAAKCLSVASPVMFSAELPLHRTSAALR